jgi:predicted RNase H-like nuclease
MAVLGVDACRSGWAGIVLGDDGTVSGRYAPHIDHLVSRAAELAEVTVVAVDIPVGLPDTGRRRADTLAREVVGPRWQSVFLTPVRAAVSEPTYAAATRRHREVTGESISRQAFALLARVAEVDAYARVAAVRVIEVHPEVSFATLAGGYLPGRKKSWAGAALRRALLARAGLVVPDDLGELGHHAAVDDVLDATVAAWSARRYATGTARCYPDPPEVFSDGHSSAIWA